MAEPRRLVMIERTMHGAEVTSRQTVFREVRESTVDIDCRRLGTLGFRFLISRW